MAAKDGASSNVGITVTFAGKEVGTHACENGRVSGRFVNTEAFEGQNKDVIINASIVSANQTLTGKDAKDSLTGISGNGWL